MPRSEQRRTDPNREDCPYEPTLRRYHKRATWQNVIITAIAALPPTIAALTALNQSIQNSREIATTTAKIVGATATAVRDEAEKARRLPPADITKKPWQKSPLVKPRPKPPAAPPQ